MSCRVRRVLLSLLMLWQLFASAFAHPLGLVQPHETTRHISALHQAVPCHEAADAPDVGMEEHVMVQTPRIAADTDEALSWHADSHANSCKSMCQCPCSGTPALSFAIALVAPSVHDSSYAVEWTDGVASQSPSKLLRPPIR